MNKSELIKQVKETDEFNNIEEIDLEEYNRDIDEAMKELENGEFITHDEVRKILLK